MRLTEIPGLLIEDTVRVWRRRLVVGFIAFVFGIIALIEALDAVRIALSQAIGPVWARVVLAGVFALTIVVAVLLLMRAERRDAAAQDAERQKAAGDLKVTAIAEAIHLGYALARDFRKPRAADDVAAVPDEAAGPSGARKQPVDATPPV